MREGGAKPPETGIFSAFRGPKDGQNSTVLTQRDYKKFISPLILNSAFAVVYNMWNQKTGLSSIDCFIAAALILSLLQNFHLSHISEKNLQHSNCLVSYFVNINLAFSKYANLKCRQCNCTDSSAIALLSQHGAATDNVIKYKLTAYSSSNEQLSTASTHRGTTMYDFSWQLMIWKHKMNVINIFFWDGHLPDDTDVKIWDKPRC